MTIQEYESFFKKNFHHTSSFLSGTILLLTDAITLFLTIGASFFIINAINTSFINFRSFVSYTIYLPLVLIVFYAAGLYPGIMTSPSDEIKRLSISSFFSFAGIALSIVVEEADDKIALVAAFVLAVPLAMFALPTAREIARRFLGRFKWWGVPVVIYCNGKSADTIIARLKKRPDLGNKPAIIIDSRAVFDTMNDGIPVFPPSPEIHSIIKKLHIKVAIMCDWNKDITDIMSTFRYTISVSKEQNIFTSGMQLKDFAGIIGFSSTHNLTKKTSLVTRRFLELLLLFILSPFAIIIMTIVAILIKATSPGPVFYGHSRIGKNRKPVKCWKFRSMCIDADEKLKEILATDAVRRAEWEKDRKFTDDPRVTKIGKILRKTSLDELPQFFNILIGEMSFVGPRPVTEEELEKYGKTVDLILSVPPGISGMWQISGRSDTGYEERVTLDAYYIQNWSVWLDIWITIKTVWVVFTGKGAY